MTNHIEKAKAALESCDGWPVNGTTDIALLAIANALVAIAEGRGTCRMEERRGDWYCTDCGEMVGTCNPESELYIDGNAVELWGFCPRCGRKVVKR